MVIAVLCYGSSAVFARVNNAGVRPEDQSLGQMLFGLAIIIPAMLTFESPVALPVRPISYIAFAWLGRRVRREARRLRDEFLARRRGARSG